MSTTITYKGSTLTTVDNETKVLKTKGTWMEDDITVADEGGGDVLIVDTPDSHGGTVREITVTDGIYMQGAKNIIPGASPKTIIPDTGYTGFTSVEIDSAINAYNNVCISNPSITRLDITGTHIKSGLCEGFSKLVEVHGPNVTTIDKTYYNGGNIYGFCFSGCTNLTTVDLPEITFLGTDMFRNCTNLVNVNTPKVTRLDYTSSFIACKKIQTLVFKNLTTRDINSSVFASCTSLTSVDLTGSTLRIFGTGVFANSTSLNTIILRCPTLVPLSQTSSFNNTPYAEGKTGGVIYVPSSLIDSYKTATNWSTFYNYGTMSFSAIEGSQYENYYADGTSVAT